MGLFDDVMKAVGGAGGATDPAHHTLTSDLLGIVCGSGSGGIPALVNAFNQQGLGNVVTSWISSGKNLPITAEQIQAVLGSAQVQALAAKAGITPQMASAAIAQILPHVVDRATPGGQIPPA